MTRISSDAAHVARQAKLSLASLTENEKARLDTNNDGQVSGAEVRAAVRVIDTDRNQFVDGAEAGKLKALLGDERGVSGRDVETFKGLSERGQEVLAGLESGFQDARAKLEQAARKLPRGEEPQRTARELKQERASLADPARLQATIQEKTASLGANSAQVKQLEAQLAQLKRQANDLKGPRLGSLDAAETLKQSIAMQEAEIARLPRGKKREALEAAVAFDRQRLPELEARRDQLKARRDQLDALQPRIAELGARIDGLKGAIAQDTRTLKDAKDTLADVQRRAPVLDAQLEYVEAKGRFEAEKAQRFASASVLNGAAGKLRLATDLQVISDSISLRSARESLRGAEEQGAHVNSRSFKGMVGDLRKAEAIKAAVDSGQLKRRDVNMERLDFRIGKMSEIIRGQAAQLEGQARRVINDLESPEFQQALSRLPQGEREQLLGRMTAAIARTQVGKEYIEKKILPYIAAASNPAEAAKLQDLPDLFWKDIFNPASQTAANSGLALSVLEGVGAHLATRADGAKLIEGAVAQALALKPGQLKVVEDAVALRAQGKTEEAKKLLASSGLGRLGTSLEVVGKSLTALNGFLTIADFIKDPSLQSGIAAGKSTAELIGITEKLAANSPRYAKFAGMVGKAAPAFDIISGAMGLYGKENAPDRGDVGGTVGNSLMLTGGIVAATGLAASGTGVGAVAGVPLTVIGGVIAGVGAGVDFVFGDSETEKWLKKNAPEYLK